MSRLRTLPALGIAATMLTATVLVSVAPATASSKRHGPTPVGPGRPHPGQHHRLTVPTAISSSPSTPCGGGKIGNADVTFRATPSAASGGGLVTVEFDYWPTGGVTTVRKVTVGSGTPASTTVFRTEFVDGTTYHWRLRAQDSHGATSAWSTTCQFTVDRTAPGTDIAVTSAQYPDYDRDLLLSTVPAGTPGQFTFDAKGDPDIVGFYLAIDNDAPTRYVPANAPGGTATVTLTPTRTGPGTVYIRTFDGVNPSMGTATYTYFALAPIGSHAHRGDLNADGHSDLISLTAAGDVCLHLGDGTGGFLSGLGCDIQIDHNRTGWRQLVRAGDWDGDGWNDLLAVDASGNLVYHYGTGAGSFSRDATEVLVGWDDDGNSIPTTGWDRYDLIVSPGDWDGDGGPDLITRDSAGELWLHRGNGTAAGPTSQARCGSAPPTPGSGSTPSSPLVTWTATATPTCSPVRPPGLSSSSPVTAAVVS